MPQTGLLRNRAFSGVVNIAELIENEGEITIGTRQSFRYIRHRQR